MRPRVALRYVSCLLCRPCSRLYTIRRISGMYCARTWGDGSSPRQFSSTSRRSLGTEYTSLSANVRNQFAPQREMRTHLRSMSNAAKAVMVALNSFPIET